MVGHPPCWFSVRTKRRRHTHTVCPSARITPTRPTLLLLIILAISFFPSSIYAAHTNLDCAAGDTILPIAVTGGVLNLVSVNIAQSPTCLDTINSLMTKHHWHVVLVQEMGIMCDIGVDMEDCICRQLSNNIHFNSPSALSLQAKQNAV